MSQVPPSGKPNYGSAIRVAQIIHWLHESPLGIAIGDLRERLGVSDRTLARYIQTLKETFYDEEGRPLVEVSRSGNLGRLRFRRRGFEVESSAYELMSLYMALDLMTFLQGTFILEGAQDALDRIQKALQKQHGHETALVLKDFQKKFFHWTEAPKDYSEHNNHLTRLVKALILQRKVDLVYRRAEGVDPKTHHIMPLSLLMYKRGLYLVGRKEQPTSEGPPRDLTFAVERIQNVTLGDQGFAYPSDYQPEQRFQTAFGLVRQDDPQAVQLLFHPDVAQNVASRRWHRSQQLSWRHDGWLEMDLELDIGAELMGWLLGYGAFVKVVRPTALRDQIKGSLKRSLDYYSNSV